MESVKRYWSSEVFDRGITKNQWTRAEDFDRVTAERDALQLLLNERDEQAHSLEQRRQAEQQACMASERRARELQETLKVLISAVRSINRSPAYKVTVIGDDEPQYRQRKEWIDWVLELCDKAAAGIEQAAPVAVVTDFKMIGTEPMPPMEYDEP